MGDLGDVFSRKRQAAYMLHWLLNYNLYVYSRSFLNYFAFVLVCCMVVDCIYLSFFSQWCVNWRNKIVTMFASVLCSAKVYY